MKKMLAIVVVLLVAFVMVQGTASAKMVIGKVKSVDNTAKTVSVTKTDPVTNVEEIVTVSVPATATLTGVASLDALKEGADVWVDAAEDMATGKWNATSVKVTSPAAVSIPATPEAPVEDLATEPAPAK